MKARLRKIVLFARLVEWVVVESFRDLRAMVQTCREEWRERQGERRLRQFDRRQGERRRGWA
jgi:hypothetical protein